MSRKNIVITLVAVAVFLVLAGSAAFVYFRRPPSLVAALIPDDASTALFFESELFTHPVSPLLAGEIMQRPDLVAAFFSGVAASRASFFSNDTGWVILSETELAAPSLAHDTAAGVFVYAEKEEGIKVIKDLADKDVGGAASRRSFLRFDASGLPGVPTIMTTELVSAELSIDGTSLVATFEASIDNLIPDVSFSSFIPPAGSAVIPVTAPIDGDRASLLGEALASFGARPQSVAVIGIPSDNDTVLLWPEQQALLPDFAEEKVRALAETLADRFPKVVVRTLPDGSTAELLTRDAKQFEPTALDGGAVATLRAGSDTLALSSIQHGRASWVIVSNSLDFVRGVRESVARVVPTDGCSEIHDRSRMVFHLQTGLVGAIDANGKRMVFCLSSWSHASWR